MSIFESKTQSASDSLEFFEGTETVVCWSHERACMGPPSQHVSKIIPHCRQCSFARISCVSPPQTGHIDCVEFGINFQKCVCCKRLIVRESCPENIQSNCSRHSSFLIQSIVWAKSSDPKYENYYNRTPGVCFS